MDENLAIESIVEFLKALASGDLLESRTKIAMIQKASRVIRKALDPVLILVSYYDHENQFLYPLYIEEERISKENL